MILILVNTLCWLALQLSIAAVAIRLAPNRFADDNRLYRVHAIEIAFYRRWLYIRRWKRMLPDGASWVGGTLRKNVLAVSDPAYLRRLVIETRRGEAAHWLMLVSFPIFFMWNPRWARIVIVAYAILANLPCIIVQRYNREAVRRLQLRREARPT